MAYQDRQRRRRTAFRTFLHNTQYSLLVVAVMGGVGVSSTGCSATTSGDTSTAPGQRVRAPAKLLSSAQKAKLASTQAPYTPSLPFRDPDNLPEIAGAPSIVVSGAVSLGAYQAGWLYVYTRWRIGMGGPPFDIATGASAGATNALAAAAILQAAAHGGDRSEPSYWVDIKGEQIPETSLFWRVWVEQLDWTCLTNEHETRPKNGMFVTTPVTNAANDLNKLMAGQTAAQRPTLFGTALTRTHARNIPLKSTDDRNGVLTTPHLGETLAIEVGGPIAGHSDPKVWPSWFEETGFSRVYTAASEDFGLTAGGAGEIPFVDSRPLTEYGSPSITRILNASGAFPVAFAPVKMRTHLKIGKEWIPEDAEFSDGGILDNNPLDLALDLEAKASQAKSPSNTPRNDKILFLDHDALVAEVERKKDGQTNPLLETYGPLVGGVLSTAMEGRLDRAISLGGQKVLQRLLIPPRKQPLTGQFAFALSGFLSPEFRAHDFYQGMSDAVSWIASHLACTANSPCPPDAKKAAELQTTTQLMLRADAVARLRSFMAARDGGAIDPYDEDNEVTFHMRQCGSDAPDLGASWQQVLALASITNELADGGKWGNAKEKDLIATFEKLMGAHEFTFRMGVLTGEEGKYLRRLFRAEVEPKISDIIDEQTSRKLKLGLRVLRDVALDNQFGVVRPWGMLHLDVSSGVGVGASAYLRRWNNAHALSFRMQAWELVNWSTPKPIGVSELDASLNWAIPLVDGVIDLDLGVGSYGHITWQNRRELGLEVRAGVTAIKRVEVFFRPHVALTCTDSSAGCLSLRTPGLLTVGYDHW